MASIQLDLVSGSRYGGAENHYTNDATDTLYMVFTSVTTFQNAVLTYARAQGICDSNVVQLVGWGILSPQQYDEFAARNNNTLLTPSTSQVYIVAVTPSTSMQYDFSHPSSLFQALFALFALNASNGFGISKVYGDKSAPGVMHYAIKTANPSNDEYDLFTVDDATETVWIVPQTSTSNSASFSANLIANVMLGSSPSLEAELREPGLRFGYNADYGVDNALFHPYFARYYVGKRSRSTLPSTNITVFEGGHLPDWTLNGDQSYKTARNDAIAAVESLVNDAIRNVTRVQKSSTELFAELKSTVGTLVDLYNSTIAKSKKDVWDTHRNTIQNGYQALLMAYGIEDPIPGISGAIKDYTDDEGKLFTLDVGDDSRFNYSSGLVRFTYYPDGVRQGAAVLLELIARVSITDPTRNRLDNTQLDTLANATTTTVNDPQVPALVYYMKQQLTTPEERFQQEVLDAYAQFDQRAASFGADTGGEQLVCPTIVTQEDLDNWDAITNTIVRDGYIAYRKKLLGQLRLEYSAVLAKLTVAPLVGNDDFDELVRLSDEDAAPQNRLDIVQSATYKDVVEAVRIVTEQLNTPPTPPIVSPSLDEFKENASPAVQKAIDALGGRTPTDADIAAIKAAGQRTPYSARFVINAKDYESFMQGYGPLTSNTVAKVVANPDATPLDIASAQAYIFAQNTIGKETPARRKALAFSQTIL